MPYAAKAKIQHEFQVDKLNIWITFNLPMNQKIKPLDTVWIVELDDVETEIDSSAWVDQFTMLLIIEDVEARPNRVTVKFDGPDGNLETTWHKNWEPWGAILSTDLLVSVSGFSGDVVIAALTEEGEQGVMTFAAGLLIAVVPAT